MYILGTEDRHLPHETGLACPHLHDFCLGYHSTVPAESFSWQLFASFQKWPKNRWNFLRDFWPKNLSRKLSQERLKKKKKHFQEMLRVRLKKSIYYTSIFFLTQAWWESFSKKLSKKKKKHWEIEISWEKTQSWGGTNPTLYTTSSTPLRQPLPVERRVVGGPSIGERRCHRCLSQWSHHQTRSRVLGMFSTFPLFILACFSRSRLGCFAGYFLFNLNVKAWNLAILWTKNKVVIKEN